PYTLFGTCVGESPPQPSLLVSFTAVCSRSCSVRSTLPRRLGNADQSRSTAPPTCGVAMDVPLTTRYAPSQLERTATPGATRSGFGLPLPSTVTGPRLLKGAIASFASLAPTVTAES